MNKDWNLLYKNLISKWLFAAVLILSFCSYSGIPFADQCKPQTYQTVLQTDPKTRITKCITYIRALKQINGIGWSAIHSFKISSILPYNNKLKTQLADHSAPYLPTAGASLFYQIKIITPNSDDSDPIV